MLFSIVEPIALIVSTWGPAVQLHLPMIDCADTLYDSVAKMVRARSANIRFIVRMFWVKILFVVSWGRGCRFPMIYTCYHLHLRQRYEKNVVIDLLQPNKSSVRKPLLFYVLVSLCGVDEVIYFRFERSNSLLSKSIIIHPNSLYSLNLLNSLPPPSNPIVSANHPYIVYRHRVAH